MFFQYVVFVGYKLEMEKIQPTTQPSMESISSYPCDHPLSAYSLCSHTSYVEGVQQDEWELEQPLLTTVLALK